MFAFAVSNRAALTIVALTFALAGPAAAVGLTTLPAAKGDGPVTVFYPSAAAEHSVQRGSITVRAAVDAAPAPDQSNGRLVVVSHGSGGTPWGHADLARALVAAGFTVALPQHQGDHALDAAQPGPPSWKRRPGEASRAIDAVGRDARWASHLKLDRVGFYGMSAGGHTGLSVAGGLWSPGLLKRHCEAHIAEDFQTCVGLSTRASEGWWGHVKRWVALRVIATRLDDDTLYSHNDPRFAAVAVSVPFAADFDMESLAQPRVPLGLATAGQDAWLVPRFHSARVLQACKRCEHLADVASAGHGAYLSPLPRGLTGLLGDLLNDPPGFDRSQMPGVDQRVVAFLLKQVV
jgi:predicted dienelactone hydrolase